ADVTGNVARHRPENYRPSGDRLPAGDIRSATITVTSLCLDGSLRTAHSSEHLRVCAALQLRNHPRAFDDPDDDGTLHPRSPRHRRATCVVDSCSTAVLRPVLTMRIRPTCLVPIRFAV